jgi:uncharacterized protein
MHHAFECALHDSNVLLIGSDCPALVAEHLRRAGRILAEGSDAVLIPVEDGGYALIGLARGHFRIFDGIEWGTAHVLEETRERLRELGWRWRELETLWDVDTDADYDRLLASGLLERRIHLGDPHQGRSSKAPDGF